MPTHVPSRCRSCRAEVIWVTTAGGKAMPVDAIPVENGNVLLDHGRRGLVATILPPGQVTLDGGPRYVSHFATCPQADQHRRSR